MIVAVDGSGWLWPAACNGVAVAMSSAVGSVTGWLAAVLVVNVTVLVR